MTPGRLRSVRCSILRSSGSLDPADCLRTRERPPHRFAHRERHAPSVERRRVRGVLSSRGSETGSLDHDPSCWKDASYRLLQPLTTIREPEERSILERTAFPHRPRKRRPIASSERSESASEASPHPSPRVNVERARRPRVEPRLTTRFQLRQSRHRARNEVRDHEQPRRAAPRRGVVGRERGCTSSASDAFVDRHEPRRHEVIEARRARTDSLALASTRTKYPGPRRLPPTRRQTHRQLAPPRCENLSRDRPA